MESGRAMQELQQQERGTFNFSENNIQPDRIPYPPEEETEQEK